MQDLWALSFFLDTCEILLNLSLSAHCFDGWSQHEYFDDIAQLVTANNATASRTLSSFN